MFTIQITVRPDEAHSELQHQIELADLAHEEAQAARNAMNAALAFLNDVGDASRDPGVRITLTGTAGEVLTATVEAVPAPEAVPQVNVPVDGAAVEEPQDKLGYAVAGQTENPGTGDPAVDNVPGHPAAGDVAESVPEPQELQDPQVVEMLDEHDADPEHVDIENPLYHTSEEALEAVGDTEGVVVDVEGSVQDVLDSVGDDPAKAQAALDAESASDKPRKSLVSKLEEIAGGAS
jgi:hypothetical protein